MPHRKKPLVVVTRKLPEAVETRMRELFDARLNHDDVPMSRDALMEAVKTADVLVPTVTDDITADIIAVAGERLKLIANFGNGFDNIDVAAAAARGIDVTNTPGVLTDDTADMTMALIMAVARRIPEGARLVPDDKWQGWSPTWMLGTRITGKRLGIIGMGRIGQAVARRAKAFGLSIHYHNRRRVDARIEEDLDATYWDSLDQMLARMDIVTVHCPHTPGTYHLLSARRLKMMKPDAILVNTARGEIVDEVALTRMLDAGELAGAGLDVFEHEPAVNPRLLKLARANRVVLLPHMGSATHEGRMEMGEKVIVNIRAMMDGHRPPNRVLPSML
ncbi:MAG: D-glycerate dehydrogenase [Hyphomicrobiales bacterium]|jgi:glyoxylate reductase|nr:D-glycerate dehydrogenase [Hyphomicrobiales bacterium]